MAQPNPGTQEFTSQGTNPLITATGTGDQPIPIPGTYGDCQPMTGVNGQPL